jgi:hypothetical protein
MTTVSSVENLSEKYNFCIQRQELRVCTYE